ncbi:hypothetical protein FM125_10360 [Micrococcus lylae]|uniref:Uncharacterized protein n=1 Tax=Micrococcus lylae TaxID=1273 RepID=A0A1R4JSL1_9MICC|nr:hypothetical protein FM125_10360 [Micrococcus lylae]
MGTGLGRARAHGTSPRARPPRPRPPDDDGPLPSRPRQVPRKGEGGAVVVVPSGRDGQPRGGDQAR